MDHTYVDAKNLKTLEHLMVNLVSEIATLYTLVATEARSIEIGILNEQQLEKATNIIRHLHAIINHYYEQAESVSSFLPTGWSVREVSERLKEAHMKKARQIARKPKVNKHE